MDATSFVFPNDPHVPWSIMIVLYPYITGLVAGAFVVSALYHVFHQNVLRPVARLALVTALCFCAFATLPLLLHLHHGASIQHHDHTERHFGHVGVRDHLQRIHAAADR